MKSQTLIDVSSVTFFIPCPILAGDGGGSPEDNPDDPANDPASKKIKELLTEKRKVAAALAEANRKLAEIEDAKKAAEEQEALKRGEFEKLLAAEREKTQKLEGELKRHEEERISNRKFAAFHKALGESLPQKFHHLIDYDAIEHDESGRPVETSVLKAVNDFKSEYPELLGKDGTGNPINNKPGGTGKGYDWSAEKTTKSNLKERRAKLAEAFAEDQRQRGKK